MKQFGKDFDRWAKKFAKERPAEGIKDACIIVTNEAKRRCPVHLGTLRQSIAYEVKRKRAEVIGVVGTDVEYAPFVEFGTRFIKVGTPSSPRTSWAAKRATGAARETMPYLRSAIYAKRRRITKALERAVKR